jgi:hypothetical protein
MEKRSPKIESEKSKESTQAIPRTKRKKKGCGCGKKRK